MNSNSSFITSEFINILNSGNYPSLPVSLLKEMELFVIANSAPLEAQVVDLFLEGYSSSQILSLLSYYSLPSYKVDDILREYILSLLPSNS